MGSSTSTATAAAAKRSNDLIRECDMEIFANEQRAAWIQSQIDAITSNDTINTWKIEHLEKQLLRASEQIQAGYERLETLQHTKDRLLQTTSTENNTVMQSQLVRALQVENKLLSKQSRLMTKAQTAKQKADATQVNVKEQSDTMWQTGTKAPQEKTATVAKRTELVLQQQALHQTLNSLPDINTLPLLNNTATTTTAANAAAVLKRGV
jgi:hypothetical protein